MVNQQYSHSGASGMTVDCSSSHILVQEAEAIKEGPPLCQHRITWRKVFSSDQLFVKA